MYCVGDVDEIVVKQQHTGEGVVKEKQVISRGFQSITTFIDGIKGRARRKQADKRKTIERRLMTKDVLPPQLATCSFYYLSLLT